MIKKWKLTTMAAASAMCILFAGCGGRNPEELNDRQKDFLEESGLSTEYSELSEEDQTMITRSEILMKKGERVFKEPLVLVDYYPDIEDGEDRILVYKEEDPRKAPFYITDHNKGKGIQLAHDYKRVELQNEITQILVEHMKDAYPGKKVWAFTAAGAPGGDRDKPAIERIPFTAHIFFKKDTDKDELKEIAEEYTEWLTKETISYPTKAYFFTVSDEEFEKLDEVSNKRYIHCFCVEAEDPENVHIAEVKQ